MKTRPGQQSASAHPADPMRNGGARKNSARCFASFHPRSGPACPRRVRLFPVPGGTIALIASRVALLLAKDWNFLRHEFPRPESQAVARCGPVVAAGAQRPPRRATRIGGSSAFGTFAGHRRARRDHWRTVKNRRCRGFPQRCAACGRRVTSVARKRAPNMAALHIGPTITVSRPK